MIEVQVVTIKLASVRRNSSRPLIITDDSAGDILSGETYQLDKTRLLPGERLGLIKTPDGYILINEEGVHLSRPFGSKETVLLAAGQETGASPDEIGVEELLYLVDAVAPVHCFLVRSGPHTGINFRLLMETLIRCGVSRQEVEEQVRLACSPVWPYGANQPSGAE